MVSPRICIDPGHGGKDPGAITKIDDKTINESDIVLSIAKELVNILVAENIDAHLSRSEDEYVSLYQRVQKSKGSDCFLSIHCNAATPKAEGIETFYASKLPDSKVFAGFIQNAMMKNFADHKDRKIKMAPGPDYRRTLYVLSQPDCPSALVECEFLTHPEMGVWLNKEETQKKIASVLSEGILGYFQTDYIN